VAKHRTWSPSEIKDMRLRKNNRQTYAQIGDVYGVSRETARRQIKQSQPPMKVRVSVKQRIKQVVAMSLDGMRDEEIAKVLKLSPVTIQEYRLAGNIKYVPARSQWTQEDCINYGVIWFKEFKRLPATTDWNPSIAEARGQANRAEAFYKFRAQHGCPSITTIYHLFPSWPDFTAQVSRQLKKRSKRR
jgi:hypothetical protein